MSSYEGQRPRQSAASVSVMAISIGFYRQVGPRETALGACPPEPSLAGTFLPLPAERRSPVLWPARDCPAAPLAPLLPQSGVYQPTSGTELGPEAPQRDAAQQEIARQGECRRLAARCGRAPRHNRTHCDTGWTALPRSAATVHAPVHCRCTWCTARWLPAPWAAAGAGAHP